MVAIMRVLRSYGAPPLTEQRDRVSQAEIASLYRTMMGLSDFGQLLARELCTLRGRMLSRQAEVGDPLYGQMLQLMGALSMLCCRQDRARSLSLMPWELSTGTLVELAVVAIVGILLAPLLLRLW